MIIARLLLFLVVLGLTSSGGSGRSTRCDRCGCLHDYGCLNCSCTCPARNGACPCCGAPDD